MNLTMGNTADEDIAMFAPGTEEHTELIQTEALVPICICGTDLLKTDSRVYGEMSGGVICDNCRIGCQGDDIVYHCPKGQKADEHKDGFDLCDKCAMKQVKCLLFAVYIHWKTCYLLYTFIYRIKG